MRLRFRILSVLAGAAALLLPVTGVTSAQAVSVAQIHGVGRGWARTNNNCIISPSPSAFVETGLGASESSAAFVLTVNCEDVLAGQKVQIDTPQLDNACQRTLSWYSATAARRTKTGTGESFTVILDNDGSATAATWGGPSCAPTRDLITADLEVAPYTTARTHVTISKPVTTPAGLSAFPKTETEDATTSSVAVIFYAEFPSKFAEDAVEFSDAQLFDRCTGGVTWVGPDYKVLGSGQSVTTTLDDNGDAFVVALAGPSCASGDTLAQASLAGVTAKTFSTHFRVLAPQ
jgi:hypothetical protein